MRGDWTVYHQILSVFTSKSTMLLKEASYVFRGKVWYFIMFWSLPVSHLVPCHWIWTLIKCFDVSGASSSWLGVPSDMLTSVCRLPAAAGPVRLVPINAELRPEGGGGPLMSSFFSSQEGRNGSEPRQSKLWDFYCIDILYSDCSPQNLVLLNLMKSTPDHLWIRFFFLRRACEQGPSPDIMNLESDVWSTWKTSALNLDCRSAERPGTDYRGVWLSRLGPNGLWFKTDRVKQIKCMNKIRWKTV